jgi:hypothetical protein
MTKSKIALSTPSDVQLRPLPYPYRAMLAICSDLDETPDRNAYWEIMRFLNTTEETTMGPGAGLEAGNSIYFDMPPDQFAYWNTDDNGREMVRSLIQSGHIDCLHSYGDLATSRRDAQRALDELNRHNCRLEVWVDHGTAVTNFGSDIMQGHGDQMGHPAYHADLTTSYGIKYVWRGRVTSITGQDVSGGLSSIFEKNHPAASGRTLLKEAVKKIIARAGSQKYSIHSSNELLQPAVLRDKNAVYEFIRCNPHWGGVSCCDQGKHIGEVLTKKMLNQLIMRGGICILYTHLGKTDNPHVPFNQAAVEAFRNLADAFQSGDILVTTTRRLLGYRRAVREIVFDTNWSGNVLHVNLNTTLSDDSRGKLSNSDLNGLTFYVTEPEKTRLKIDGREITDIKHNNADYTGLTSVSLPWPRLKFPTI